MAYALSEDTVRRIIKSYRAGTRIADIAKQCGVSASTVEKYIRLSGIGRRQNRAERR